MATYRIRHKDDPDREDCIRLSTTKREALRYFRNNFKEEHRVSFVVEKEVEPGKWKAIN